MLFFGHLGIGLKIAQPWSRRLSKPLILLGAILPDLIDKSLFFGLYLFSKTQGIIAGSRNIGHTALLLVSLMILSAVLRIRSLAAICLGMATHLVLDYVGDQILYAREGRDVTLRILAWPFLGWTFPSDSIRAPLYSQTHLTYPYLAISEILGLSILLWMFLMKSRHILHSEKWIIETKPKSVHPSK